MKGLRLLVCIITFPLAVLFFLPLAFYFDIKLITGDETIHARSDALGSKIKEFYVKFIRWE